MSDDEGTDRLIGRSFRNASLEGADFSGKDLRSADFGGADLRNADFANARVGVAPRKGVVILGIALLVAIATGVAIGWFVDDVRQQVSAEEWDRAVAGGSMGMLLLAFIGVMFWRGFDVAVKSAVVLYLVVVAGNIIANFIWEDVEWFRVLRFTVAILMLFLAILAGILGRVIGGVFGDWSIVLVAGIGGLSIGQAEGGIAGIVVAMSLALISKRAVKGDRRDRSVRRFAHRLIGRHGTQFTNADLTGANFDGVDGSRCAVKGATLDGVKWDDELPRPLDIPDDALPVDR